MMKRLSKIKNVNDSILKLSLILPDSLFSSTFGIYKNEEGLSAR